MGQEVKRFLPYLYARTYNRLISSCPRTKVALFSEDSGHACRLRRLRQTSTEPSITECLRIKNTRYNKTQKTPLGAVKCSHCHSPAARARSSMRCVSSHSRCQYGSGPQSCSAWCRRKWILLVFRPYVVLCHSKPNPQTVSENARIRFILHFTVLFCRRKRY